MTRRSCAVMLVSICFLVTIDAQGYPPAFPREGATKLIENDRVVVWEAMWEKGKPTPVHEHRLDTVAVVVADGTLRTIGADGVARPGQSAPVGSAYFLGKGAIHAEERVSDAAPRVIWVELKEPKPESFETVGAMRSYPDAFPREGAKQIMENERVTIWDAVWTKGQSTPMHRHVRDTVTVTLTGGEIRETRLDGASEVRTVKQGEVRFNPKDRIHREEGVSDVARRAIIVELK